MPLSALDVRLIAPPGPTRDSLSTVDAIFISVELLPFLRSSCDYVQNFSGLISKVVS